jgi:hypothetical protein
MDPASDQQQRQKRLRFSPSPGAVTKEALKGKKPLDAAKLITSTMITTLQSPAIIRLAEFASKEFLTLRTELAQFSFTKRNLANQDLPPRSARFKFTLGATDRVKERSADDFDSLVEKNKMIMGLFHDDLKEHLSTLQDLEMKSLRVEIGEKFCISVNALAKAYAIHADLAESQAQILALHTVNTHSDVLFEWTEVTTASFKPAFKAAIHDITPVDEFGVYSPETIAGIEEHVDMFYYIINGIYAKPWRAHKAAEDEMKKQTKLNELVDLHFKETATSQTAMDFEDENLTQAAVKDLVADTVAKATRSMQRDIAHLKKQLASEKAKTKPSPKAANSSSSKNNRGAQNASAPSPKKKSLKKSRNDAQKADESDNASTAEKNTRNNRRNNASTKSSKKKSKKSKRD